jgi:hypothetical protein
VKSAVQPLLPRGPHGGDRAARAAVRRARSQPRRPVRRVPRRPAHLGAAIAGGADTAACLQLVRDRIGLGEAMDALDSSRTRPEGSSHGDDLDALEQLAALHPEPATFRDWLTDRLRVPGQPDGVTLSTIHRVKGMEWDRVVVYAANAGLFPHRLADDVEEERRIFHVAVTRCRRHVDIIADRERISPFVGELTRAAPRTPPTSSPGLGPHRRSSPLTGRTDPARRRVGGGRRRARGRPAGRADRTGHRGRGHDRAGRRAAARQEPASHRPVGHARHPGDRGGTAHDVGRPAAGRWRHRWRHR